MVDNILKQLARHLKDADVLYMIIGGQAVLLYGTPTSRILFLGI